MSGRESRGQGFCYTLLSIWISQQRGNLWERLCVHCVHIILWFSCIYCTVYTGHTPTGMHTHACGELRGTQCLHKLLLHSNVVISSGSQFCMPTRILASSLITGLCYSLVYLVKWHTCPAIPQPAYVTPRRMLFLKCKDRNLNFKVASTKML